VSGFNNIRVGHATLWAIAERPSAIAESQAAIEQLPSTARARLDLFVACGLQACIRSENNQKSLYVITPSCISRSFRSDVLRKARRLVLEQRRLFEDSLQCDEPGCAVAQFPPADIAVDYAQ
jgi:hypothetical protein